jgi:hypothetical protein
MIIRVITLIIILIASHDEDVTLGYPNMWLEPRQRYFKHNSQIIVVDTGKRLSGALIS